MNLTNELKSIISSSAPILGAAISSASPLAGMAFNLITSAFGVKSNDPNILIHELQNNPNAAIKLKQIELDHEQELAHIAADNYKIEVEDRKDARQMARSSGDSYVTFLRWFAVFISIGFFCMLGALLTPWVDISPNEKQFMAMLVGVLVSKWQTIIDFFYGSSSHNVGVNNGN